MDDKMCVCNACTIEGGHSGHTIKTLKNTMKDQKVPTEPSSFIPSAASADFKSTTITSCCFQYNSNNNKKSELKSTDCFKILFQKKINR